MPSRLETAIAQHRAALLAGEIAAQQALAVAYRDARRALVVRIDALVAEIGGQPKLTGSRALRLERAVALLDHVEAELRQLGRLADDLIEPQQRRAVALAREQARDLAIASVDPAAGARIGLSWNALPADATADLIGRLSDGSSLDRYFANLPADVRRRVEAALKTGIATGLNPIALAKRLAAQGDLAYQRLLTVARNEILGAHRSATLRTYAANGDVLSGWIWIASLSTRTCPACLALHGREFALSVGFMATHSRCRCGAAPRVKGAGNEFAGGGERWFADQDAATQDRILRVAGGGDAYRQGRVTLRDFVVRITDERWGDSYQPARSLGVAEANAERRTGRAA